MPGPEVGLCQDAPVSSPLCVWNLSVYEGLEHREPSGRNSMACWSWLPIPPPFTCCTSEMQSHDGGTWLLRRAGVALSAVRSQPRDRVPGQGTHRRGGKGLQGFRCWKWSQWQLAQSECYRFASTTKTWAPKLDGFHFQYLIIKRRAVVF